MPRVGYPERYFAGYLNEKVEYDKARTPIQEFLQMKAY
jgi:hypothetical protein